MANAGFSIVAPPSTDIWRKAPNTNAFNAPSSKASTGRLNSFVSAKIQVRLPQERRLIQYDQGGILLSISKPAVNAKASQWLKSGIEFYNSKPWVGTVGCDQWADWSIADLCEKVGDGMPTVTLELERSNDKLGRSLWIYASSAPDENGKSQRVPIREVNWIFADEPDDVELSVSAYAARPQKPPASETQELEVFFDQFEVQWR